MNKVYKVIWSKVKNCYVVASELAKSHTKSPKSGIVGYASLAFLESKINMDLSKGFVAGVFPMVNTPVVKSSDFKITVAAIVKNEAENVPTWVQSARSCADEIVVVDTGSTDGTVERFRDYGIQCFHYDWNDDFASAKNYMISLCHGDWIVLLDGDEWFREGCDVRKAIAKHHGNPITKAIIADWICLDKDRNNAVMFSGGAVRAFRNQPDVRYFRRVHENLTIGYENFAFEPEFKMFHTGYSGSVNRSKHERNLRIMRTMFDFDNGKVEYPTDWRYIEDTYAGLGQFDKALWAADKMISYGIQEYSASAWITKFNVLFAMKTPLEEMKKQFEYCFRTVPSVSGFRFLASIYFFRNGLVAEGLDNYIEGLRMLMGPQDKVAMEHTYWRMYMPEASALACAVYLQNRQVEASLYSCKVCEQYCGQTDWTNGALADVRRVMNQTEEGLLGNISERVLPVLQFGKKAVLATALVSSLTVGMVGVANPVFASQCNLNGLNSNTVSGIDATVTGGYYNTASGRESSVAGGCWNVASAINSFVAGGYCNTATGLFGEETNSAVFGGAGNIACGLYSVVVGGNQNKAEGISSLVSGGYDNIASGCYSSVSGGQCNTASGCWSSVSGGESNTASGCTSSVSGGYCNEASGIYSSVTGGGNGVASGANSTIAGGQMNVASGTAATVSGGQQLTAIGTASWMAGGMFGTAYADYSSVIGGGTAGTLNPDYDSSYPESQWNRQYLGYGSVAIGEGASTTQDYEVAIGSSCAPVTIGGNMTVTGTNTVTDGTTTKTWTELLSVGSPCFADGVVLAGCSNTASGCWSSVSGGQCNTASSGWSSVSGGFKNTASGPNSSVSGGYWNTASGMRSSVSGGQSNTASGDYSSVSGGYSNEASGNSSWVAGGCGGIAYACYSSVIGGGITGIAGYDALAIGSVAIGKNATTTRDYEVAIGSACAPVTIGGNLKVTGTNTVTDGTTTKSWTDILNAGSYTLPAATASALGGVKIGSNITNSNGTISLTKANVTAALGYTPPTADTDTHYTTHLYAGSGTAANATTTNGNTKLTLADNSTVRESITIKGTGATTVTSSGGVITINSTDNNTTYSAFTGASASAAGSAGLVKAPSAGDQTKFLRGDGTWATDNNTTYSAGTGLSLSGTTFSVNANGSVASGNAGVLNGGTVYSEVRPTADGTFAKKANTTAANITALDTAAKNAIKALSVSGQTITYTKGDGTTGTITTQDNNTTYDNMSATELSTGTATTARSISAKTIADYVKGQVSAETTARTSAISSEATTRADADTALGTRIDGTIKDLSVSGTTITYTKGDGTTGTITTQDKDTTYTNMSATELNTGTATTARSISAKVVSDYVTGKVSAETTARTTAINSEATTRANADTALGTRIDNAITAYEFADTGLSNRIGSLTADGNYIKKAGTKNVSENLSLLDAQLKTTTTAVSTEATNRSNADTALGTRIDNAVSAYKSADTALGNRIGTVGSDGNYIRKSSTNDVATNLSALDTQLKATDTAALKYDGSNRELATLGGTNGTKLTNLKQGTLSASSTDAVTGAQLYSTNLSINGFSTDINRNKTNIQDLNVSVTAALASVSTTSELVDTINSLKADASLNNLTAAGRQVIATAAANAVQEYIASQQGFNAPMAPMMYSSSPTASNTLNITDAGNGSLHVGEGSYVNGTSSIAIGVGNQVNANNSGAFGDPSIIDADESYVLGNDDNIKTGATGSFIVGNDSVADAEGSMIFGSNVRSTGRNGIALGNNSKVSAENAVALGYGSVATEENTVSVGNGILKRRITNLADGDVSEGSSDAVTGNQLHEISEYVKRKAEADASNIDVDKWSEKLATGVVEEENTGLVNGGAVYSAIDKIRENSLVKSDGTTLTIGKSNTATTIDVSNSLGEGRVVTGVATNPEDPSSAANVGYVNTVGQAIINGVSNEFTRVNDRMNKIGANAVALASLTPASFEGDEKWSLAASAGHYKGETAGAIGAFYRPTENVMMNVRGAFGNGENMIGAGVAVSLSKGDVPGLTKRQLAVTVNKQSEVINTLQQERDQANARLADQERRIAELEKIVRNISNKK